MKSEVKKYLVGPKIMIKEGEGLIIQALNIDNAIGLTRAIFGTDSDLLGVKELCPNKKL